MKKVRGRAIPTSADIAEGKSNSNSHSVSMTLLVTLPLESTVTPLLPKSAPPVDDGENNSESPPMFNPFSFEDYAWRVYHERLLLKDPLVRYRL